MQNLEIMASGPADRDPVRAGFSPQCTPQQVFTKDMPQHVEDAREWRENRAGNERLRARFKSLPHERLVEVLVRVAALGNADKEEIDKVLSEVAPLPKWCVTDVLLSLDLMPRILTLTSGREGHRAAHVCTAWAAWRRQTTQSDADEYVRTCSIISTTMPPYDAEDEASRHALVAARETLRKLAETTIRRPSYPAFSITHLLEAEARMLNSTWLPACGFSFQPERRSVQEWIRDREVSMRACNLSDAFIGDISDFFRRTAPIAIWKCTVPGIDGTLLEDGLFTFDILIGPAFPLRPPVVLLSGPGLLTRFHNQIFNSGKLCSELFDTDRPSWDPACSVAELLLHLLAFLHRNNNGDPAVEEPFRVYNHDRGEHDRRVREWAVAANAGWAASAVNPSTKAPIPPDVVEAALQPPRWIFRPTESSWVDRTRSIPVMTRVANGTGTLRLWRTFHLVDPITAVGDVEHGVLTAQVAARAAAVAPAGWQ